MYPTPTPTSTEQQQQQRPTFGNHLNRKCERTHKRHPNQSLVLFLSGNYHLHTLVLFSCEKKNEHIDCSLIILFMILIYKINKYCQILVISEKWLHFSSICELLFLF